MKIIIPIEFYRKGGVERVIISLITSLAQQVDQIILVLPYHEIPYFKTLLPETDRICYENFQIETKVLSLLIRLSILLDKFGQKSAKKLLETKIRQLAIQARLNELIQKYQAEYCLYAIINKIYPPKVSAHLSGIAYDLFWMFAPLTYLETYRQKYNEPLEQWLKKANLVFTISYKTCDDILKVFPNSDYQDVLAPVPLSGFLAQTEAIEHQDLSEENLTKTVQFYFPSSFGIYKDHLTFLKAGIILAQQGLDFKIVLVGRETDGLIGGRLKLSQQSQTKEYRDYVEECQELYAEYSSVFEKHFVGLGYSDYEKVEYLYQTSSCVVMPSKYEGFGLAVSEAIVRGLPVIASDLDVFREQVNLYQCPDRVQFFPVENAAALAECMENFIKNPLAKLATSEIEERFAHWTWDAVAQAYIKALQSSQKK